MLNVSSIEAVINVHGRINNVILVLNRSSHQLYLWASSRLLAESTVIKAMASCQAIKKDHNYQSPLLGAAPLSA